MRWRTLCEDTASYQFPVVAQDYFEKLISIWRTQCQSVNRRVFGTVAIPCDSEEYGVVVQSASTSYDNFSEREDCEVRKLIAKDATFSDSTYEASFTEGDAVIFIPVQLDANHKKSLHIPFPYKICCTETSDTSLRLTFSVPADVEDSACYWMLNTVFPAMLKWLRFIDPKRVVRKTNGLLELEAYSIRYRRLKETYGRQLVENWTERTDPKKFVYEDCGIATYLLELWRSRGCTPKKFADLGCGNGLLVHLLNKEGVNGIGIDIRKRQLWSEELRETVLIEAVIDPSKRNDIVQICIVEKLAHMKAQIDNLGRQIGTSDFSVRIFTDSSCSGEDNAVPDDVDYLIGNHTDELTPWMPIMAARRRCNFFVLPCCPFNFSGKYVARTGDTGSQYDSFLRYVREICTRLGYLVEEDRLSIPSTKRLCFVCTVPPEGLAPNLEDVIEELTGPAFKCDFVPRNKNEQVRNCLNVPKDIREDLTMRFFRLLLDKSDATRDRWRCGGAVELGELASFLTFEEKQLMKQQCGGLQTFLRNQHQVFKVTGGRASIRDWREDSLRKFKKSKVASPRSGTSPCWMQFNHPDGCPMKDKCQFKH